MHQYKTVARILLILSIFDLVLAAPVVRDTIYDARDHAAPTGMRNVAVMLEERHQSRSDGATASPSSPRSGRRMVPYSPSSPDGSSPPPGWRMAPISPPSPDGSSPSDREGSLHEWSPTSPELPAYLFDSSPSEEGSLHELPIHADEPSQPTSLPASSPPPPEDEVVQAAGQPVPLAWQGDPATMARVRQVAEAHQRTRQRVDTLLKKTASGVLILVIAGSMIAYYRHRNHRHRTIDPDWYVSNPSYRRLNLPNHKRSDL